jgi:hypothetical protein
LGGQSRLFGIGAIVVYFDPLNVTDAPLAYAVQLANAGRPAQLTCADATSAENAPATSTPATTSSFLTICNPPKTGAWRIRRNAESARCLRPKPFKTVNFANDNRP